MNKDNFFKKFLRRLKIGKMPQQPEKASPQSEAMLSKLLQMVENTDEVEIACDEVFELLDLYVECEARGEDVATLLPLVKSHLEKCQDCFEEYEALARAYGAISG